MRPASELGALLALYRASNYEKRKAIGSLIAWTFYPAAGLDVFGLWHSSDAGQHRVWVARIAQEVMSALTKINVSSTAQVGGLLYISGSSRGDRIVVSANGLERIVVRINGALLERQWGASKVVVYGNGGNDTILLANNASVPVEKANLGKKHSEKARKRMSVAQRNRGARPPAAGIP